MPTGRIRAISGSGQPDSPPRPVKGSWGVPYGNVDPLDPLQKPDCEFGNEFHSDFRELQIPVRVRVRVKVRVRVTVRKQTLTEAQWQVGMQSRKL